MKPRFISISRPVRSSADLLSKSTGRYASRLAEKRARGDRVQQHAHSLAGASHKKSRQIQTGRKRIRALSGQLHVSSQFLKRSLCLKRVFAPKRTRRHKIGSPIYNNWMLLMGSQLRCSLCQKRVSTPTYNPGESKPPFRFLLECAALEIWNQHSA